MNIREIIANVLLVAGLVIVVASCVGIAVLDDAIDRLHLVTPAATLGSAGICCAALVRAGLSASGLAAIAVATLLMGTSPFTSHAMARCVLVRRRSSTAAQPISGDLPAAPPGRLP